MLIATYSFVPRFLGSVVVLGLCFVTDMSHATNIAQFTLSPARFMDASASALVITALSRLDITVLWATGLIAVAYATIGKASKGTAWTAAILLWVLGALPALLGALRG
jgi:hypothetical protein